MSKSLNKAKEIISLIQQGQSVDFVKAKTAINENEWYNFSSKAYNLNLEEAKKERKKLLNQKNASGTSNEEIIELLELNEKLADFALAVPSFVITSEFTSLLNLSKTLPGSESKIIELVGKITLDTRMRVLQKKGRIEKFDCFKMFSKIIDAAIVCYYRRNFISSYLTLIPVIEGIIIRWMGYKETDNKPEFEDMRRFFKNSALRQPCPSNIQFHYVFIKVCDKILNNHFFKPTTTGNSYSDFNRHVASHLLNDNHFANKENCIRLFILLDIMTEIYVYESRGKDPRFNLTKEEISDDVLRLNMVLAESISISPEDLILNKI